MYEGEIVVHKTTYENLPVKISPVFETGKSHEDSICEAALSSVKQKYPVTRKGEVPWQWWSGNLFIEVEIGKHQFYKTT
jgi:hypothetical protein